MSRITPRRLALILAAAILPACHGGEPNAVVPAGAAGPPGPAPAPEPAIVSWSRDVWPILQVRCQLCHTGGSGVEQVPDMRMSDSAAVYDQWVRIPSKCNPNLFRVLPGQPDLSFVWDKVAHVAPMCGARMPLEGAPLQDSELETIRLWIAQGAVRN